MCHFIFYSDLKCICVIGQKLIVDDSPLVLLLLEVRIRIQKEHLLELKWTKSVHEQFYSVEHGIPMYIFIYMLTWPLWKKLGKYFIALERMHATLLYWPGC